MGNFLYHSSKHWCIRFRLFKAKWTQKKITVTLVLYGSIWVKNYFEIWDIPARKTLKQWNLQLNKATLS